MDTVTIPGDRVWPPRGTPADRVLAAGFALVSVVEVTRFGYGSDTVLVAVLGLVIAACLAWRRTHPLPALAVGMAAFALLAVVEVAANDLTSAVAALLVLVYSVAMWDHFRPAVVGLAIACLAIFAVIWGEGGKPVDDYLYAALLIIAAWGLGRAMRRRLVQVARLAERAARAEADREHGVVLAVADERARIARELHDIVSHGLSVMVVQAAAAEAQLTDAPDAAGDAMRSIQDVGRDAQADMARMLAVLREHTDRSSSGPMPGIDDLPDLVERVRAAGLPVTLDVTGTVQPVPAAIGLTAYRVVQEALTNVHRHAGAVATDVHVAYGPSGLRLTVSNVAGAATHAAPGATIGSGVGLVGLRERVATCGGTLTAGPGPDGDFVVAAELPSTSP